VVSRDDEERPAEAVQEARRRLVLSGAAEVREVAGGDDELRCEPLDERRNRCSGRQVVTRPPRADVQIRHVEDACMHRRRRLQ
jgi:hypothetical protein